MTVSEIWRGQNRGGKKRKKKKGKKKNGCVQNHIASPTGIANEIRVRSTHNINNNNKILIQKYDPYGN